MAELKDFHHYKGEELSKFEKVERKIIELIDASTISDSNREDSKYFEFMHAAGCMQIARILAQKRNLDIDMSCVAAGLHDISVIVSGSYKDHAKLGGEIAKNLLAEIGGFSDSEIATIANAIVHHSEKEIQSTEPYTELVKDTDAFDCSLYKNAEGFYRLHKAPEIFEQYVARIQKVREELGLPKGEVFR